MKKYIALFLCCISSSIFCMKQQETNFYMENREAKLTKDEQSILHLICEGQNFLELNKLMISLDLMDREELNGKTKEEYEKEKKRAIKYKACIKRYRDLYGTNVEATSAGGFLRTTLATRILVWRLKILSGDKKRKISLKI